MTEKSLRCSLAAALTVGFAFAAGAADARDLTIGMATAVTTLDPHEDSSSPNNAARRHIWDSLINRGGLAENKPQLAESWQVVDDTHWEFKLREGVKFHDGSDFDAEDVVASLLRARDMPSQSFASYTRNIADVTASDDHTVVVETRSPDPLMLNSLSRIRIIPSELKDAESAAFDSGEAAIGTGPFKFESYAPGEALKMTRNEDYFDGPSDWDAVTLRFLPDDGARLAALLSGGADLIEALPAEGVARVESDGDLKVIRGQSTRLVYLGLDVGKDQSPFVSAKDGSPLDANPLKDERVRRALLLAMNREAIVDRVMQKNGTVADQFVAEGFFGYSDAVEHVGYDPEKAKELLAEAGYPDGFKLTIHGPQGRYVNDSDVVQAAGQMLARIGIDTSVEVMPWSMYSDRYAAGDFSMFLGSWGINTGEVSNPAVAIVAKRDADKGTGRYNGGGIDVAAVNELVDEATRTLDDAKREAMLQELSAEVFNHLWLLPMHYENVVLGAEKDIEFKPRSDKYTLAYEVHSAD